MSDTPPTLVEFIRTCCTPLSETRLLGVDHPSQSPGSALDCSICLSSVVSSSDGGIQVDNGACRHTFDAECLSRYVLAGYNNCPLCREIWFEIPADATTARTVDREAEGEWENLSELIMELLFFLYRPNQTEPREDDISETETGAIFDYYFGLLSPQSQSVIDGLVNSRYGLTLSDGSLESHSSDSGDEYADTVELPELEFTDTSSNEETHHLLGSQPPSVSNEEDTVGISIYAVRENSANQRSGQVERTDSPSPERLIAVFNLSELRRQQARQRYETRRREENDFFNWSSSDGDDGDQRV
ncbi:hypothetical protein BS50DRAFT_662062 [Corynespora cassiicola Philippines]|uniref:RING-type domain-containing protein n=1 Tax=Corynespora cassiicola Philippines TaxID=1448308 RepID=A0A2T2NX77_CORCC|nr:hypothetical protein BS50DRAFT_662062 [Corynespora cassiicola Philippines]